MPIYEYKCTKCGNRFERIGKYDDVVVCNECHYIAQKTPSLSNFSLKGGGWAKDGYSKRGNKR